MSIVQLACGNVSPIHGLRITIEQCGVSERTAKDDGDDLSAFVSDDVVVADRLAELAATFTDQDYFDKRGCMGCLVDGVRNHRWALIVSTIQAADKLGSPKVMTMLDTAMKETSAPAEDAVS